MTDHKSATREEWLAARMELLKVEKALTRRSNPERGLLHVEDDLDLRNGHFRIL